MNESLRRRGSTLVEAVIAIAVLAVAIPMVFGALAESGRSGLASRAETRGVWIVPACMKEVRASREGRPRFFEATVTGQEFPPEGEVWALGFAADGSTVGRLPAALYRSGTSELHGAPIRYITTLSATRESVRDRASPTLRVDITLEYPAIATAAKRVKLDFHTRIP